MIMVRLVIDGNSHELKQGDNSIGRDVANDIVVGGAGVSADQCILNVNGVHVVMRSLCRSNWINGARVQLGESVPVTSDDQIHIGVHSANVVGGSVAGGNI